MKPSRYSLSLLLFAAVGIASLLCLNYFEDVYRVFHPSTMQFSASSEPNTRFLKTEYLSEHCGQFDTMIFGNSQSVAYETATVDEQFRSRAYNYGVSDETPIGIWQKLRWLESIGCVPQRTILTASVMHTALVDYTEPRRLLRMEHYYLSDLSPFAFYRNYLASLQVVTDNLDLLISEAVHGRQERLVYDISRGDVYYRWDEQFDIAVCPRSNIKIRGSSEFADMLGTIKLFAEQRGSEVVLLLSPDTIAAQVSVDPESFEQFIGNLARHFDSIYRISVNDERLRDSRYYRDPGHFKPGLASDVLLPENLVATTRIADEMKAYRQQCS